MNSLLTLAAASDATLAAGTLVAVLLVSVVIFGLWIWSLIHCATNKQLSDSTRIVGIILIVVLGLLGSIIYLFLPREQPAYRRRLDRRRAGTDRRVTSRMRGAETRSPR